MTIAVQLISQTRCQPDADSGQKCNATNERTIMLCKAKTLTDYKLESLDGEIGEVKEYWIDELAAV